jgi:4-amino-4-deoxy-L-arabinose transferase-like glycosyltransferase
LVWLIAAAMGGLLLAVAAAYGFHRDELYFILAGRHPAFGYVDQPPLTPLLSAAAAGVFGVTPVAVRILPAVIALAGVVLVADLARRLGASRTGQILAALVFALSGWLGAGHLDETTTYDIFFWTLAIWLLVPLLEEHQPSRTDRWRWVAVGIVGGVALQNKTLALALPATLVVSLVAVHRWDVLGSRWAWLAAVIAALIWAPNAAWQAANGFPQVVMAQHISADQAGIGGRIKALVELLALAGLVLFPVAIAGLIWLLRSPASRPWRALGLAALCELGLMLLVGGKSYYAAGFLPLAIAAGSIPLSGWLNRGRQTLRRSIFGVAAVGSGLASALILLPIVPLSSLQATPIPTIYGESVAQAGWPQLAAQVGQVVDGLPPNQRSHAVIVTADYGQYSALVLLGSGLPPVYSGHNSTYDWGRPSDGAAPIIVVAFDPQTVATDFLGCQVAATIDNGYGLPTQEQGESIWVCAGPIQAWSKLWPSLRHID